MFFKLAFLFIVMPIVEIALLVKLGQIIDFWPTMAIVLATGLLGAWLTKRQGGRAMRVISAKLAEGTLPTDDILDGLLILAAGIVLITPGILTDITGILLLISPSRAVIRTLIRAWITRRFDLGTDALVERIHHNSFEDVFLDRGPVIDVSAEQDEYVDRAESSARIDGIRTLEHNAD